jgi:hypothetical protein
MPNDGTAPGGRWRGALIFLGAFALGNAWAGSMHYGIAAQREANLGHQRQLEDAVGTPRRDASTGEALGKYWPHIPDARAQRLVVVVGMSQMYWINDQKAGDQTISEYLDDHLREQNVRVFGLAAPNLDNEEALLYLLATASAPNTLPYAFIYGICFDKFRNTDLRPGLQAFLRSRPELLRTWEDVAKRHAKTHPLASAKMLATQKDLQAQQAQGENTFESRLRTRVGSWLPVVAARKNLHAAFLSELYLFRNWALGIKVSTKRPIIGARYDLNREFLELLASEAKTRGVKLLPYIIPLNPQAESPYVESEHRGFKQWLSALSQRAGLPLVDLEDAVPKEEWGLLRGEPDFKHFTGAGHRRTARAVAAAFDRELLEGLAPTHP